MRSRVLLVLLLALAACAGERTVDSAADFCREAVPLLSDQDVDAGNARTLRSQMRDLNDAAAALPEPERSHLRALIEPVLASLDDAVAGKTENGWSTVGVADHVATLCDDDNLIGWVVQP